MNRDGFLNLDQMIHAPIRLAILSVLINVKKANFTFLKESTETSDGNLSTHLTKLEANGYITIQKLFKGKKPQTLCAITRKGRKAFLNYIDTLEQIVKTQKAGK